MWKSEKFPKTYRVEDAMRCFLLSSGRVQPSRFLSVAAGALATVASMAAPGYAGMITFGVGAGLGRLPWQTADEEVTLFPFARLPFFFFARRPWATRAFFLTRERPGD